MSIVFRFLPRSEDLEGRLQRACVKKVGAPISIEILSVVY